MPRLNSYRELEHLRERLREQRRNITTTVMICGGPAARPRVPGLLSTPSGKNCPVRDWTPVCAFVLPDVTAFASRAPS
jgi:hypothetical protein